VKRLLIVILLLLCAVPVNADQPTPDVSFEKATLTDFTMIGVGTWICTYNVMVNHAPLGDVCDPRGGQWVAVDALFTTMTMTWDTAGLADAVPGSAACLYWYCYTSTEEMLYGTDEIVVTSPYTLYLPSIVKGDACRLKKSSKNFWYSTGCLRARHGLLLIG